MKTKANLAPTKVTTDNDKGVIRIRKSNDRQHTGKRKRTKGQTTIVGSELRCF